MPEIKPEKPIIVFTKPLSWLDNRERQSMALLMAHYPWGITSFENTLNILSFAVEELEEPIKSSPYKISDLQDGANNLGDEDVKNLVTVASLVEALDSVHAARRLLLSGYSSKMMAALRTMVESLRTADICKNDITMAQKWLQNKQVKKPVKGSLHPAIKRMMQDYDFLSKTGTHPLLFSAVTSSIGKPYHSTFQGDDGVLNEAITFLIEFLNKSAARFLEYLDDSFSVDWSKEPEIEFKKNTILGVVTQPPEGNSESDGNPLPGTAINASEIQSDSDFLSRLETLFKEPPRMPTTMSISKQAAFIQFIKTATDEMREMAVLGLELANKTPSERDAGDKDAIVEKEKVLVAGAFGIAFEMGHDYAVRWGKAF